MPEKYSSRERKKRLPTDSARILLVAVAIGLVGAVSLFPSCARKPRAAHAPAPDAAIAAEAPKGKAGKIEAPAGPAPGERHPAAAPALTLAAALRAFGLGVPSVPRMPEDYALGPLQSYRPAAGDEAAAFAVARKFMDGVAAGKLDTALLLPEAREALSVLLEPPAQVAPPAQQASDATATRYRLGAIVLEGDDASLLLRMPRAGASSAREEGLLSLRKESGAWYVQALALKPPDPTALVFAPDAQEKAK